MHVSIRRFYHRISFLEIKRPHIANQIRSACRTPQRSHNIHKRRAFNMHDCMINKLQQCMFYALAHHSLLYSNEKHPKAETNPKQKPYNQQNHPFETTKTTTTKHITRPPQKQPTTSNRNQPPQEPIEPTNQPTKQPSNPPPGRSASRTSTASRSFGSPADDAEDDALATVVSPVHSCGGHHYYLLDPCGLILVGGSLRPWN